jgi:hypothetical protein
MHGSQKPLLSLGWHYDIREIDEDLYFAVLACRLSPNAGSDSDLSNAASPPQGLEGTERDC